jgi:ABC-2 family transporter protein
MIQLTWLQFRAQAAIALAALAACALVLAITGPRLASMYTASEITGCHGGGCATAAQAFLSRVTITSPYPTVYELGIALILITPAITGIFWGAPLIAREFEAGTIRLAWTQSVTRTQWLAVKLTVTCLAAMAVTGALSLMLAWWADPISKAISVGGPPPSGFGQVRLGSFIFATTGVTPLGYAAFGFALGTMAGAFLRRGVPAMALTLAVFAAVQVAVPLWVRPHLIPPHRTVISGPSFFEAAAMSVGTLTATTVPGQPQALITASGAINAAGQPVSSIPAACLPGSPLKGKAASPDLGACMASRGIREAITYQPASRYWPLQWLETGIFLALALALAGCCFWRLARRRT